jgi:GTPase
VMAFFRRGLVEAEIFLPWSEQNLRGNIFENFEVLEERADGDGTLFRIRGESDTVNALRKQLSQTMDPSKSEP